MEERGVVDGKRKEMGFVGARGGGKELGTLGCGCEGSAACGNPIRQMSPNIGGGNQLP